MLIRSSGSQTGGKYQDGAGWWVRRWSGGALEAICADACRLYCCMIHGVDEVCLYWSHPQCVRMWAKHASTSIYAVEYKQHRPSSRGQAICMQWGATSKRGIQEHQSVSTPLWQPVQLLTLDRFRFYDFVNKQQRTNTLSCKIAAFYSTLLDFLEHIR